MSTATDWRPGLALGFTASTAALTAATSVGDRLVGLSTLTLVVGLTGVAVSARVAWTCLVTVLGSLPVSCWVTVT